MSAKNILVTGGDVQIFAAILNGLIVVNEAGPKPMAGESVSSRSPYIVGGAFAIFDEYKRQHAERENELKGASRQAFKGQCDKSHGGGACRDPDCWQR